MLSANDSDKQNRPRWIWFITGPTACGKTTVAKALAQTLGLTFVEGDDVRLTLSFPLTHPMPLHY
jgi:gluconokinase